MRKNRITLFLLSLSWLILLFIIYYLTPLNRILSIIFTIVGLILIHYAFGNFKTSEKDSSSIGPTFDNTMEIVIYGFFIGPAYFNTNFLETILVNLIIYFVTFISCYIILKIMPKKSNNMHNNNIT